MEFVESVVRVIAFRVPALYHPYVKYTTKNNCNNLMKIFVCTEPIRRTSTKGSRPLIQRQALVLIARFEISVNSERSHKITASALNVKCRTGFNGYVAAIRFIDNVLNGNGQIIRLIIQGVHIIIDSDKPNHISGKHPPKIPTCFDVFTTEPRQVLDDNAIRRAAFDMFHHFFERGAVKQNTAVSIVNLFTDNLNLGVLCEKIINQLSHNYKCNRYS